VASFQSARGLTVTGSCDVDTWTALVEASWQLGDRTLTLRSPHLRGDDVAELQTRLGRLGFDCGRVDGIFGPRTAQALLDLQENCGLDPDGICGVETVRVIVRLCRQSGDGPGIGAVREVERLRTGSRTLAGRRVVVGQLGGLATVSRPLIRHLRRAGAHVVAADEPDPAAQAATANRFDADLYLGLEAHADPVCTLAYYAVPTFVSAGGHHLAHLVEHVFPDVPEVPGAHAIGMRLPVLRETRMPAVLCQLGPVRSVVDHGELIAAAVAEAIASWVRDPLPAATR
jgi:N-acetylmuramoyl-L-alanine amidase